MTSNLKAIFLDMDGVLWRGLEPIGDLKGNLERIERKGLHTAFITNNATRSKDHYVKIFEQFGVKVEAKQIYTSAHSTAAFLSEKWPNGGSVFIIGESGLIEALGKKGFQHDAQTAMAVVAALDRQINYEKLSQASLLIQKGVPFYGTNPDRTLPSPPGLVPGAGSIIAAIESASGSSAEIIGKPQARMLVEAMQDLEVNANEVLMVGDRLETDIAAGQNAGCQTALLFSGASTKNDYKSWSPKANFIGEDLAELLEQLL